VEASRHVVCIQNHDQTGNRMLGERIASLVPFESQKLAAGAVLLSPFLPLLFMGEEWGETAPFLYFISHTDEDLVRAVQEGRREEFAAFGWQQEPPDPQASETFERSRPNSCLREREPHRTLRAFYRELIRLRKGLPALARPSKSRIETGVAEGERVVWVRRWNGEGAEACLLFAFGDEQTSPLLPLPAGSWTKVLDSAGECWRGEGSAAPAGLESDGEARVPLAGRSVVVYARA
jgi:maltooligosyltrehalose trehalohydrolase